MHFLELIIGMIVGVGATLIVLLPYYTDVIEKKSAEEYSNGYLDGLNLKSYTNESIRKSMWGDERFIAIVV